MPEGPAIRRRRTVAALLGGTLVLGATAATAALAASQAPASSVALSVTPGTLSVLAGDQGTYDVSLKRKSFTGQVALSVSGLPAGASGAFTPNNTTESASQLKVTTSPSTPLGTYTLTIGSASTLGTSTTTVKLTVTQPSVQSPKSFTISGELGTIAPGAPAYANLILTNPNNQQISVTNLNVTVALKNAPNSSAQRPCSSADFGVTQMAATAYPISVPANGTRNLAQAVADNTKWPQVRIVETGTNQDGCKGASLTLTYTGTAQGGN